MMMMMMMMGVSSMVYDAELELDSLIEEEVRRLG